MKTKCRCCGQQTNTMMRPVLTVDSKESGGTEYNEHAEVILVDGTENICNSVEEALVLYREQVEIYRGRMTWEEWDKANQ
jgi:hypothetical protein